MFGLLLKLERNLLKHIFGKKKFVEWSKHVLSLCYYHG